MRENKNEIVGNTNVSVVFKKDLKEMLDLIVCEYPKEFVVYLTATKEVDEKDKSIKVILKKGLIPYQKVGKASACVEVDDLVRMRQEYQDECAEILAHFHSHNDMGEPFFSGTDEDMMKDYAEHKDFVIFIIGSKHNGKPDYKIRLVLKNKPYEMVIENVPYEVEHDNSLIEVLKAEIEKKVIKEEEKVITYTTTAYDSSKERKALKKEIAKKVIYLQHQNHKVKIEKLMKCFAEFITEEFKVLNPVIQETPNMKEHYDVLVELGDKNRALEFMVDVKELLLETLMKKQVGKEETDEEDEISIIEDDFEELEMLASLEEHGQLDNEEVERLSELRREYHGYSGNSRYNNYGTYGSHRNYYDGYGYC